MFAEQLNAAISAALYGDPCLGQFVLLLMNTSFSAHRCFPISSAATLTSPSSRLLKERQNYFTHANGFTYEPC
jgi:hypothetical protein